VTADSLMFNLDKLCTCSDIGCSTER